jgi:predicted  nucleic acid-binding Zn-ribbon protein
MADQAISQQVSQWVSRLTTISRNLMDLSEAESTKLIRARLQAANNGFVGSTQVQAISALAMLDRLLEQYALLAHVIDEAADLASRNGLFRNYDARIKELLVGPSVILHTQQVGIQNRGLLEDEHREIRTTPSEALASMEQSFANARNTLVTISDAMARLRPRLATINQSINDLNEQAKALGIADSPPMLNISNAVSQAERDPLGGSSEFDSIEQMVIQRRVELQRIATEHQSILASIERGKGALKELRDTIARSRAAFNEAQTTILPPVSLISPASDEAVDSLDSWLQTLAQNVSAGRFDAVRIGITRWEQAYNDLLQKEQAGYEQNNAELAERIELRGRFNALCAKANILRSRGLILDRAVEEQTRAILDAVPFDVQTGRRLVKTFEAALANT